MSAKKEEDLLCALGVVALSLAAYLYIFLVCCSLNSVR